MYCTQNNQRMHLLATHSPVLQHSYMERRAHKTVKRIPLMLKTNCGFLKVVIVAIKKKTLQKEIMYISVNVFKFNCGGYNHSKP